MTEVHSSIRLAEELDAAGFSTLAKRARAHEFHDFRSPHALPQHTLVAELDERGAHELKSRVQAGEFDASKAESDEWAASPEGKAAMEAIGVSRSRPPRRAAGKAGVSARKCTCGHIACVCGVIAAHDEGCRYRKSVTCPVGIECEHGYDVCPKCDPCTCDGAQPA